MFVNVGSSFAQKPLKGVWNFTFQTPSGPVTTVFTFKNKGKGTFIQPSGTLQLVYREDGAVVSISGELINDPTFGNSTALIRGRKTDDNNFVADLIIFTETADTANSTGLRTVVVKDAVSGRRQQ